jgi:hypothetical protein
MQNQDEEEEIIYNIYQNETNIDFMCRKIKTCERLMDANTSYCVCCAKCYDKYYYAHTHKKSRSHRQKYNDMIKYLCNVDDERVVDIILYTIDN